MLWDYVAISLLQVDKWYVVLNGQFKLVREDEEDKIYSIGDS